MIELKKFDSLKGQETFETFINDGGVEFVSTSRLPDGGTLANYNRYYKIKRKRKTLKQLSDAVDNMPTPVILWDKDHKLVMANKETKLKEKKYGKKFQSRNFKIRIS